MAVSVAVAGAFVVSAVSLGVGAAAPPPTGCKPAACTPGTTVGLTNSKGQPIAGSAGLYAWGQAEEPDGSILVGDYWNFRIVHYNANGTEATPFVFTKSKQGFGNDTSQEPFGICVDNSGGPFQGYVYMTEGSLYNVVQYDPNGNWVTSWGTTNAVHAVNFDYPSQCVVGPNGLVYIANQWGGPKVQGLAVLNPTTNVVTFESPPAPNAFIQTRSLAFDSAGNLWVADQGHHRIDIFYASSGLKLTAPPQKKIAPPGGVGSTFDMRGLAIDTTTGEAFVANGQNCLVQSFNANPSSGSYGAFLTNFNGVGSGSDCGTGNGQFEDGARDVAVDGNGNVWVGDLGDFRAEVFNQSGVFQFAVPDPPAPPPTGGFNGPRGVAFDSAGDMYVTDTYNERIEEFTLSGGGGFTFDRAWGVRGNTANTFNYPRLMCIDSSTGDLVVANTDSSMVVAWNVSPSTPKVDWSSTAGGLADPYGVACAPDGTIYVANSNGDDVVAFTSAGAELGTMGSTDKLGFTRGIWVDSDGSVWVDNDSSGNVYHFAAWSAGGAELGHFDVNTSIPKAGVFGIAGDSGYLYVALSSASEVAEYTRAGTLVGTFGGYGSKVGQMRTPQGLAFGPGGDLYVVENDNSRVSQWSVP
jgi:tripartite motif-containing protein 71